MELEKHETVASKSSIFQAKECFSLLFGNYNSSGIIEIRCLKDDAPPLFFFKKTSVLIQEESEIEPLLEWNKKGYDIYFGVNPRPPSQNKKQKDIKDVVCLWLDIDGKDFEHGKKEALNRIMSFGFHPNIIVDSGNGYHVYWVFDKPIINCNEINVTTIKQILSGLATALGADRQTINLDRVMRLPGTLNFKNIQEPKECRLLSISPYYLYFLDDFMGYQDFHYIENKESHPDLSFGKKELIISDNDPQLAIANVKKLEISQKIKKMIISGDMQKEKGADKTRSGRDQAIITALIASEYNYPTIKSIFFNSKLGCSNRIRQKKESALIYDVGRALKLLSLEINRSPQMETISNIKATTLSSEEKLRKIANFIIIDLFGNTGNFASAYRDRKRKRYYFFDKSQKLLMDIEETDFRCFIKDRYGIPKKDFDEILESIRTHIWSNGENIEAHDFSYFDTNKMILYISNFDNRIYKLDGQKIELVDNGNDGVIFKDRPEYNSLMLNIEGSAGHNYFERGFNWGDFANTHSLVFKHIISKARFSKEERYDLTLEEQKYLLAIYLYSLPFATILHDKPILCIEGVKASGKSFLATALGKFLFGDSFLSSYFPENRRDFLVTLSENYYIAFDNVDSRMDGAFLNDLCIAATGGEISARKLYTNSEEIRSTPQIFIVLTTRDPKFKRDDFVDRLLIFNTEKIKNPISKSALYKEILANRNNLWAEYLVNLNSIVKLLKQKKEWNPPGNFRIADWELLGKKIHSEKSIKKFEELIEKMNRVKNKFSLEDDPLYILLKFLIYEQQEEIKGLLSRELYENLKQAAGNCRMNNEFEKKYKNSMSLSKRLTNIRDELSDEFSIEIEKDAHGGVNRYSINAKKTERQNKNASEAAPKDNYDNYELEERMAITEINGKPSMDKKSDFPPYDESKW